MVTKASPWWHVCVQVSISVYSPQCSVLLFKSINKVLLPVLAGERWPQKLVYRRWQQRASVAPLPQTRQRRSEGSGERGTRRTKGGNKTETVRRGEEGLISLVSMSGCETHRQPLSGEKWGLGRVEPTHWETNKGEWKKKSAGLSWFKWCVA